MLPPEQAAGQTTTATVDEKSGEVQETLSQLDKLHGNDAGKLSLRIYRLNTARRRTAPARARTLSVPDRSRLLFCTTAPVTPPGTELYVLATNFLVGTVCCVGYGLTSLSGF